MRSTWQVGVSVDDGDAVPPGTVRRWHGDRQGTLPRAGWHDVVTPTDTQATTMRDGAFVRKAP